MSVGKHPTLIPMNDETSRAGAKAAAVRNGKTGGLCALFVLLLGTACGSARSEVKSSGKVRNTRALAALTKGKKPPSLPQLVPPLSGGSVNVSNTASDGSRYLVSHGLRMVEHPDGSLDLAAEFFPATRSVSAVALPERFGGGFVFYSQSSGSTLLWKAPSWTGRLVALAQVDGEVSRLVPGLDRLFLQRDRRSPWIALDPEDGKPLDLAGLPPSPSYGAMAFADEWFGAVEVPYRGLVATFDAGASFRPVGISAASLSADNGQILMQTQSGALSLGPDGVPRPVDAPRSAAEGSAKTDNDARQRPIGPLGPRPLELAVLRGFPLGSGEALVAAGGALGRVRLRDGAIQELRERAYPGTATCLGIALGTGAGFACAEPRGKTLLYAVTEPFGLTEVMSFEGPRFVAEGGSGALAIRGSCQPELGTPGSYCIVPRTGQPYELAVEGDLGVERVIALDDGRALVLIPPRLGAQGSLALIEGAGTQEKRVTLKLPKSADAVLTTLLKHGLWLDGFEQFGKNQVRGFIAGDGPLVGVRISFDGKVELGKVEHGGLDRALISGPHAVVLGRNGTMVESSDGGFEWRTVDLPAEPQLGRQRAPTGPMVNGCSRVGCAFAGWLRIGYSRTEEDGKLPIAGVPSPVRLPPTGGGRWSLSCEPSSESSAPSASAAIRSRTAASTDELVSAAWLPFWEEAPPRLSRGQLGFDLGTETELNQMHAYVWGPAGADWGKVGQWQVKVGDRYRAHGGVWSTSPTRSPWASAELAADAFGQTQSGNITVFRLLLDASGRTGLLTLASRGRNELYLVEEGRAITPVRSTGSIGAVTSVVRLDSGYFVSATSDSRNVRLFRVQGGRLEPFADYPDIVGLSGPPQLVTNRRRNALGLWTRGASWYVHPIDIEKREVDAPLELTPAQLSRLPRACSGDEDGWLLEGTLGVEPYVDFPKHKDSLATRNFEARLIASEGELCADSLAAQSDEPVSKPVASGQATLGANKQPVPLVLSDRHEQGRRWGFKCY